MIENSNTEYKQFFEEKKPKSWLKTIAAFANTNGGHLVFGVTDKDHKNVGISDFQTVLSKISELIAARITPYPRFQITETQGPDEGDPCIDIMVDNGPDYPYYYSHEGVKEAYVRHGDRSEIAKDHELRNLVLRGKNKTFDALPSGKVYSDVSFTLLSAVYKKDLGDSLEFPRDLISMGLMDSEEKITNAGLLVSDQGALYQSKIVCTRWKGLLKGSVDGDALDDKEFKNQSLIALLNDAESFVRNNSRNPWTVRGMKREEFSDYPYSAVREVLVNALIHRDYQIVGSEIHVDMFDDRIEVTSPGGMLSGKCIQDLDLSKIPSIRRNEIIADLFSRLHYMDRRGSGIGRILLNYVSVRKQPDFYSDTDIFYVMLPNRNPEISTISGSDHYKVDTSAIISGGKVDTSFEKVDTSSEIVDISQFEKEDWELSYFTDHVMPGYEEKFREKRKERLILLFKKYRYRYSFNRRIIADIFEVSENTASIIISKCLELGLFEKMKQGSYRFSRKK